MNNSTVGREPIQVIEIVQPVCAQEFGVGDCGATGEKCFNTRASCKFIPAYLQDNQIKWRFVNKRAPRSVDFYSNDGSTVGAYAIPSLVAANVSAAKLNVGGINRDSSALGTRGSLSAVFQDHPYDDSLSDPYLDSRGYIAVDSGTFWGKWLARNKYYSGWECNLYEGYAGQQLAEMRKRRFVLDKIGMASDGQIALSAKDPLYFLDQNTATFPETVQLTLRDAITTNPLDSIICTTNLSIEGATAADQLNRKATAGNTLSNFILIDDEIIEYELATNLPPNVGQGAQLSFVTRGVGGTTAADHDADEKVLKCGAFFNVSAADALFFVLTEFGNIDSSFINLADWQSEVDTYLGAEFILNGYVTKPTSVKNVVADICEQVGAFVFYDEEAAKIRLKTIRPESSANIVTLNDDANIVLGSVNRTYDSKDRVSRYFYYTDIKDATLANGELANWGELRVRIQTDKESSDEYGSEKSRTVFARYITDEQAGEVLGRKIITRFGDERQTLTMTLDMKDEQYKLGDVIDVSTRAVQDFYGNPVATRWQIISKAIDHNAGTVLLTMQNFEFIGSYANWSAGEIPDYNTATAQQKLDFAFWCDESLTINGEKPYFWW